VLPDSEGGRQSRWHGFWATVAGSAGVVPRETRSRYPPASGPQSRTGDRERPREVVVAPRRHRRWTAGLRSKRRLHLCRDSVGPLGLEADEVRSEAIRAPPLSGWDRGGATASDQPLRLGDMSLGRKPVRKGRYRNAGLVVHRLHGDVHRGDNQPIEGRKGHHTTA